MRKTIIILLILFLSVPLFGNYSSLTKAEKTQIIWALQKAKIYNDIVKSDCIYKISSKLIKSNKTGNKFTSWYQVQLLTIPNSTPNETITNILVVPVITEIKTKSNLLKYLISFIGGGVLGVLIAK